MGRLTRGARNIKWIEKHCRIPEGKFVGEVVRLRPFQKKAIRKIYDTPTRLAIISFARKNAKTTLAAFLLLLHTAGPEAARHPNGQLYSAAQSRDQAAVIFNLAAKIIRMSPTLSAVIGIRDSAKQLYCEALGTLYRALSKESSTAFGLSPVFTVHDELGQVRGPRSMLYEALETAAGAHENPLSVIISTQAPSDADLLSMLIDDAIKNPDPRTKLMLWTAPEDMKPFTKAAIRKANPAFGDFLIAQNVLDQMGNAKRMPSRQAAYENLVLNRRVNMETPFIPRQVWKQNTRKALDLEDEILKSVPLRLALDLSARNDLTALAARWEIENKKGNIEHHCHVDFFAPMRHVEDRATRDRAPYDTWAEQGHITLTPGASVDYKYVAKRLIWYSENFDLEAVFFDRWRIDVLEAQLYELEVELPLIPHGQGFKDMSPALDDFEAELMNARCRLGNNPVLSWCAANAVISSDEAGNRKLNKKRSTGRIDGMVALTMTFGSMDVETEEHVSGTLVAA